MAFIRVSENRVRQRALADNLVLVLVLVIRLGSIRDVIIGGVVVRVVNLHHVVTVALGINGFATGNVGMIFAAVVIRITGEVQKVVRAPGLHHTRFECQTGISTLFESPPPSDVVVIVKPRALFRNTLILAWRRSRSGQSSQGGQDGECDELHFGRGVYSISRWGWLRGMIFV